MSGTRRGAVAAVLALGALGAIGVVGRDPSPTGPTPSAPSATVSPPVDDPLRVPFSDRFEPFDYRDAPPLERTAIDGWYVRIVTLEELGGPVLGMPTHCRRCVPYEIDPGLETLTLYRGRYYLDHQLTGRRGLGHYVVRGHGVRFFNDPNCSGTTGTYRWSLRGRTLSLTGVRDPCPFGPEPDVLDHRARDLTFSPWTKVRVCTAQIERWWPPLFGCAAAASRSS